MRPSRKVLPLLGIMILAGATVLWAGITGSISGIITDPSGSVVPGVTVTATNTQTGVQAAIQTDSKGFYNFAELPIGDYTIQAEEKGFKEYLKNGIHIDANSAIRVDIKLEIGTIAEKVTVTSNAVQVETQSTQMGEVIDSQKMTAVPLNGRDFTDLLNLQPGVVPSQYAAQAPGLNDRTVSGSNSLNSGNQSINGQREAANGFMINGANANEGKNNGTAVIPNLDSIEEFRIITNNFDAEYGNYSGGQVNVVTKAGTNQYHGDLFEFNRNTAFNGRDWYAPNIGKLIQNQFGGTIGGPIKRDKTFFFADYQGTRLIDGQTATAFVPSLADRQGNLADQEGSLTGTVQGTAWAQTLTTRLGYPVTATEPYFYTGCTTTAECVLPGGQLSPTKFSPAAAGLLPYIPQPTPNLPANANYNFATSAAEQRLRDDKAGIRLDQNTSDYGVISGYWHVDDDTNNTPYPNGGANVPGFNALSNSRAQIFVLGDTKSFGSTAVNDLRFSYLRSANHLFTPQGGLGVSLASLGFTPPAGSGANFNGGIAPVEPSLEGVPSVSFALLGLNIGVPTDTTRQFNNTFQWQDGFTKIIGTHSIKFGGQFHYDQINDRNFYGENGAFTFDGSESGSDIVDFLLGAPAQLIQASEQILDSRSKYMGLYAQDSWRVTPNLTFNYGLRWEFSQPWYDTQNKIETLVPGEQSVVFPGAPLGWVVPGDPGVPSTLAPTQYHNFSPRIGIAYSPGADSGLIAKITGGPGKMSIRAGYGIFYTAVEDLTQFQEIGDPPYGLFYVSPAPPLFETPFIDRGSNNSEGQRFPFIFPPTNVGPKNPDTTFNWAGVEPLSGTLAYDPHNVLPRAEDYELSIERQFGSNTVLSVSYVGNQGHKLISVIEANPGNPTLCLQLIALNALTSSGQPCGDFGEAQQYILPLGVGYPSAANANVELIPPGQCGGATGVNCVVNSTYTVLGPNFNDVPYEATIAQSSYNSLQVNLKHSSGLSTFLIGYTYAKCMDNASGLQEGLNPFDPRKSIGLCIFDVTQNFVASYETRLPFDRLFHATSGFANKIAAGWAISGITTFATGLPVTLSEADDNSFTGTQGGEAQIDLPDFSGGKVLQTTNPRNGGTYFDTSLFSPEAPGTIGNSRRRFFHGPGLNNWDMALIKDTSLTETKSLQFRFEAFNIWNHAQFSANNSSGFGVVGSSGFGQITATYGQPRILQAALKFLF
ncbi:MAG TPA: TonB-dependent receptor, partial [Candidatus Aquilonibacter sp.]|nr:TonB-dependent receptor [Candidatus Aquilonibacter sp.]